MIRQQIINSPPPSMYYNLYALLQRRSKQYHTRYKLAHQSTRNIDRI
nr:MAG TPA: hypothetical protein [Caudoviricetes sp.]